MFEARSWVERLRLHPHPEGGYFREMYRSGDEIPISALPDGFPAPRTVATHIYYLLMDGQFSAFHRIRSDELWHHYHGDPLEVHVLGASGHRIITLSREHPFDFVPAGDWFAARLAGEGSYALCGCTVAPGFDFEDFEMAEQEALLAQFPGHGPLIESLTRG